MQHRDQTCRKQFEAAKSIYGELIDKDVKHTEYKRLYHAYCEESEQLEIQIEKDLLSQMQGDISMEKVQETMNQSLNAKYKVQVA